MLPLKGSLIYYRLLHCKIRLAFVNYRSKKILIYSDKGQFICYFHALLISVPKKVLEGKDNFTDSSED